MKILTDTGLMVLWNKIKQLVLGNRPYNPSEFSGKGYKVLEKNIQTVGGVKKNILTAVMLSEANTIYEIRYDFNLDEDITIPNNCVLKFDGGSINGEHTITGTNTDIQARLIKIFDTVTLAGTWKNSEFYLEWYGCYVNTSPDLFAKAHNKLYRLGLIKLQKGIYNSRGNIVLKNIQGYCDNGINSSKIYCFPSSDDDFGFAIGNDTTDVYNRTSGESISGIAFGLSSEKRGFDLFRIRATSMPNISNCSFNCLGYTLNETTFQAISQCSNETQVKELGGNVAMRICGACELVRINNCNFYADIPVISSGDFISIENSLFNAGKYGFANLYLKTGACGVYKADSYNEGVYGIFIEAGSFISEVNITDGRIERIEGYKDETIGNNGFSIKINNLEFRSQLNFNNLHLSEQCNGVYINSSKSDVNISFTNIAFLGYGPELKSKCFYLDNNPEGSYSDFPTIKVNKLIGVMKRLNICNNVLVLMNNSKENEAGTNSSFIPENCIICNKNFETYSPTITETPDSSILECYLKQRNNTYLVFPNQNKKDCIKYEVEIIATKENTQTLYTKCSFFKDENNLITPIETSEYIAINESPVTGKYTILYDSSKTILGWVNSFSYNNVFIKIKAIQFKEPYFTLKN